MQIQPVLINTSAFGILEKFLEKQRGDPLKNFVSHRTDFDLVTLSTSHIHFKHSQLHWCHSCD
jgi:hypothetical protein